MNKYWVFLCFCVYWGLYIDWYWGYWVGLGFLGYVVGYGEGVVGYVYGGFG